MLLSPGELIGEKYRVLGMLGRGGMGEVWSAQSLDDNRMVAVKVLLERAARRKNIKRRFEREAEAVSRIHSAHVCALVDQGWMEGGGMFIVFELLKGESLADRLRREVFLPVEEIFPIIVDVLQGVADAHAARVLHRDLKPGNIYISPGDHGRETGIVLDFGVSKLVQAVRSSGEATLTAYDGTVGSFAYMAPEQVRGAARVDARADVYGAAAVAFRAIVGRLPFEGASARMVASLKLEKEPPTLRESTGFEWPRAIEEFFERGLAKDPMNRYPTALDAKHALEQIVKATHVARARTSYASV